MSVCQWCPNHQRRHLHTTLMVWQVWLAALVGFASSLHAASIPFFLLACSAPALQLDLPWPEYYCIPVSSAHSPCPVGKKAKRQCNFLLNTHPGPCGNPDAKVSSLGSPIKRNKVNAGEPDVHNNLVARFCLFGQV